MKLPVFNCIWRAAVRVYRCEKGAEGLEKLLIIGAIVIPLLGALIFFRDQISEWVSGAWSDVQDDVDNMPVTP
jgi:Flp pilus assembly pilin Flp